MCFHPYTEHQSYTLQRRTVLEKLIKTESIVLIICHTHVMYKCPVRTTGREILIIRLRETWIRKPHRNVRNEWVTKFYKKDSVTTNENERREFRRERGI